MISNLTRLRISGVEINSDLTNKEDVEKTSKELGYTKCGCEMDIPKLHKYLVVQAATHLLTNLNNQERWSQVNKAWLHVTCRMTEGFVYKISKFIVETIINKAWEGEKISFGVILLSLVFMEISVPNGPKDNIWMFPLANKYLEERFKD